MTRRKCYFNAKRLLVLLALIATAFSAPARAELHIDITQGNAQPMPVALPDLPGSPMGAQIMGVVSADLERSGLFKPIDHTAFIEHISEQTSIPNYADWRQINATALVTGSVTDEGSDKLRVAFRLWDVYGEQQLTGKEYHTFKNNWRRIAHIMADEIYKRMTGESGYFDSRIVYISESGPDIKRIKRLAIMDQDGENHKFLTDGRFLVLTPRFSPNSQEILYLSYAGKEPRVYLRDLQTGREESLGTFEGMSFAPRFSNDGNSIIMSIAHNGITRIYKMDLRTRRIIQITDGTSIDTSPSYSPDGNQIVFNSDRGGSQQLYVMNADGSNVRRISFGSGAYGTPVWSPRGDLIAFTKPSTHGNFSIGVMRPDGSGERILNESYMEEGPSWSPNGRVIIFHRQEPSSGGKMGRTHMYTIDLTGYNLREVATPMDASDPAWSPLLPL